MSTHNMFLWTNKENINLEALHTFGHNLFEPGHVKKELDHVKKHALVAYAENESSDQPAYPGSHWIL